MNVQLGEFIGKALVPFAVVGAFALFRKYFPNETITSAHTDSIEILDSRFRRMQWIFVAGMVGIGILFAFCVHAGLVWINKYLASTDRSAQFLLLPQSAIWWFLPGFGALALSYEMTLQVWSLWVGRKEVALYSQWANQKTALRESRYAGMDSRKVLRWFALIVVLPIGVLTVLNLPVHASLGQEEIHDCSYAFTPCKVYPYAAARRITIIQGFRNRDGQLIRRAGIVLDFNDGSHWSSADKGNFRKNVDPSLVEFLQEKTLLPINYAETDAGIPANDAGH